MDNMIHQDDADLDFGLDGGVGVMSIDVSKCACRVRYAVPFWPFAIISQKFLIVSTIIITILMLLLCSSHMVLYSSVISVRQEQKKKRKQKGFCPTCGSVKTHKRRVSILSMNNISEQMSCCLI